MSNGITCEELEIAKKEHRAEVSKLYKQLGVPEPTDEEQQSWREEKHEEPFKKGVSQEELDASFAVFSQKVDDLYFQMYGEKYPHYTLENGRLVPMKVQSSKKKWWRIWLL